MALTELPATHTVMTADDAAKYLAAAYKKVAGKAANFNIMKLLIGQWAGETGNGASMFNYNFGNTMPVETDKYYQILHASEIIDGQEVKLDEKFAAYKTPAEGALAYINVLKSRPHWWNGLQSGTVDGFINGLTTAPKYFTASADLYKKLLISRINAYLPAAKKYASTWWGTTLQVLVGLGLGGTGIYYYGKKYGSRAN